MLLLADVSEHPASSSRPPAAAFAALSVPSVFELPLPAVSGALAVCELLLGAFAVLVAGAVLLLLAVGVDGGEILLLDDDVRLLSWLPIGVAF